MISSKLSKQKSIICGNCQMPHVHGSQFKTFFLAYYNGIVRHRVQVVSRLDIAQLVSSWW